MDRGYIDFLRLFRLHQAGSFFVTRAKRNMDAQRRYWHPAGQSTGVIFDAVEAQTRRRTGDTAPLKCSICSGGCAICRRRAARVQFNGSIADDVVPSRYFSHMKMALSMYFHLRTIPT
jgi:hypothetical protein